MELRPALLEYFPSLNDQELLQEIERVGNFMQVPAETTMMEIGGYVRFMPLILKGAMKVMREDEAGNEVFLYFIYPGQTCAVTIQCCLAHAPSQIKAVSEEDTEMIAIPIDYVNPWLSDFNAWKSFILETYSDRFSELLHAIDSVVFHKLDERLLSYLKERVKVSGSNTVKGTHQQIAYDLHSSREVISRLLKQLERMGEIKLGRNKIVVL